MVVGIGDGDLIRRLATVTDDVLAIALPGENADGLPATIARASGPASAEHIVSAHFSRHAAICQLPATRFFDRHAVRQDLVDLRLSVAREFYELLSRRPLDMGDCVMDGMQGVYHVALNAEQLLPARALLQVPPTRVPAIAIGAGPSLARHLDRLRVLQHKALLVSCDSALPGLLRAGITPHVVTPLERVIDILPESFPAARYPGITFAGVPVVLPEIVRKFDTHLLVPGADVLYQWACCEEEEHIWYGQSTGVLAVAVALAMTRGLVYLVGHDLSFAGSSSHWSEVSKGVAIERKQSFPVPGNGGVSVQTQYWWDVFRREIQSLGQMSRRLVNVNAADRVGAVIAHTDSQPLPKPDDLPDYAFTAPPPDNRTRLEAFRRKLRIVGKDARGIVAMLSKRVKRLNDIDMHRLCPGPNRVMFSYLLRSVLGQFSLEHVSGKDEKVVAAGAAEAITHVLTDLFPMFDEMARC